MISATPKKIFFLSKNNKRLQVGKKKISCIVFFYISNVKMWQPYRNFFFLSLKVLMMASKVDPLTCTIFLLPLGTYKNLSSTTNDFIVGYSHFKLDGPARKYGTT